MRLVEVVINQAPRGWQVVASQLMRNPVRLRPGRRIPSNGRLGLRDVAAACRRRAGNWVGRPSFLLMVGTGFIAAQPTPITGQVIHGVVRERDTEALIASGEVRLLRLDGVELTRSRVTDIGTFTLRAPAPGTYRLSVRSAGYVPVRAGPVALGESDSVEVRYLMQRFSLELDPVVVQAAPIFRELLNAGYYRRQQAEHGHFLGPRDIERQIDRTRRLSDLFSGLPGVTVQRDAVVLRGVVTGPAARSCATPRVFIDGVLVHDGYAGGRFNDLVHPEDVRAIEVYTRPATLPAQFGGATSACGVIVIWTGARYE